MTTATASTAGATRAAAPETLRNYIGGRWVEAAGAQLLDVPNPATEEILARVPLSTADHVAQAARAAREAFREWSEVPVPERVKVLFSFREAFLDNRESLIRGVTTENGKIESDAAGEYRRALEVIEFAIGMPTLMAGYNVESVSRGIDTMLERYPLGVTAAITPFNFPLMVPLWTLPIAIAAGNAFILKPSERTPLSATALARLLEEAGLPPGVFNLVHGAADAVQAICAEPEIDAVSFVGSARVAKIVYEACGRAGKRVQALGGAKNHIVVMPDAVVKPSVEGLSESAFGNAGQRCLAGSVLTVVGSAAETVLPRVIERAESMRLGFGLDEGVEMGPVIRPDSRERIHTFVQQGLDQGARMLRDGRSKVPDKGYFVGPTLIEIEPDSVLAREELFGPVLSVLRADTIDHAIRLVTDTNEYGNASSIFTSSGRAAREFRRRNPAGMIGINVGVAAPVAFFPFSGHRNSFFGDLHVTGRDGVEFFTRKKTTTTRWF
ncbi:MAG: CoA-acylating methylmalonate-semialdehyde dehydrogenase [Chloroflexi bacterium]|nr:CoA-acylating methylmalonate-semialdehyde dehydrogenase [Chloroflexota bacterium]